MAERTSAFDEPYWNLYLTLSWIMRREEGIAEIGRPELSEEEVVACLTRWEEQEAREELRRRLARGEVTCYGRRDGFGDLEPVPNAAWSQQSLYLDPPKACRPPPLAGVIWRDLVFPRDQICEVWPSASDPSEGVRRGRSPRGGRPKGTGIDDTARLDEMAELLASGEAKSRRAAAQIVYLRHKDYPDIGASEDAAIRRLLRKFNKEHGYPVTETLTVT